MASKNILVVVDSINVNDSSGSKANVALIQNLSLIGCKVKVYHYTLKEIEIEGVESIAIKERKWSFNYLFSRGQRIFTRITKININPFIENVLGFSFTFFNDVKSIEKCISKETEFKPDLVLTLSKGASFRPHFALLKLPHLYKKWIAYIHDPYPFHFYPRPYNWVEPGFKQKERFFKEVSEKAQYSAFPSELLKDWMGSYFPNFLKTGVIIPHQKFEINNTDINLPTYFDQTKFNILHAGNLMKQRNPEGLINGFQLFLEKNPSATKASRLLLLGPASYHQKLLKDYMHIIPELIVKMENISFNTVFKLQMHTSVNIILESKSEISPFLPGKFPHCVAANKPILLLAPYYCETKRLLGNNYSFISEVDDVKKIATIIEVLYKRWENYPEQLKLNRPDLEEYVSSKYLNDIITSLTKKL